MKIQIKTQSDTLFGTAGGGALVDSTTRHDKYGFPLIPAKTLKGLLRESVQEVLEMVSQSTDENKNLHKTWLEELFGKEGVGGQGRLAIATAKASRCQDKDIQREKVEEIIQREKREKKNGILPEEVLSYFTRIRYQTAIDDLGIAEKGSLRSARVIKKEVCFETALTGDLNDADKQLIHLACLNLRRAGTNRNRGWGRIKVDVVESPVLDIDDTIKGIEEYLSNKEQGKEKEQNGKPTMSLVDSSRSTENHVNRDYKITCLSPVLLPKEGVDANTVSAAKVIPGRKILGMLASKYIQKKGKESPEKKDFTDLFLNGNTRFSAGFPYQKEEKFFPLGNHWSKPKSKIKAFTDFNKDEDHGNAKSIKGLYSRQGEKADTVSTILDFHNSRNSDANSRVTGKNQGDGIYYYEAIAAGQSFWTQISGEEQHLEALESLMGEHLRLGKAAHTQYGRVKMERLNQNQQPDHQRQLSEGDIEAVITFVSPVLLKDANTGEYNPSLGTLKQYLDKLELSNKNCRFRTQTVKVFQGKINRQLPEALALAPGSSFQLKNLSPENRETIEAWVKNGIGEATHEGYGQILVETNELQKIKIQNLEESMQADEKEADGDRADDSLHSSNNLILEHIWKQKQIKMVKGFAIKDAGDKGFHKNTVTLMIKFWKDVLNDGKFSEKEMKKLLSKALRNDIPKKPLENLEQLLGKGNQFQPVDKKEGLEEQKKYAGNLATKVLEGFSKYTSIDRKLENNDNLDDSLKWHLIAVYWLQYFSMLKLNNRKKNEN